MKNKDLIAILQKFPKNAQVMIWEGFNSEFVSKIKVDLSYAERSSYNYNGFKQKGEWSDTVLYADPENIERKKIICIQCKMPAGKKVEGLR